MNTKTIGIALIGLVIGFGAGYFLHITPTAQTATRTSSFTGARGAAGATAGGFLMGTVAAEDSNSITLDTRDGSSHVVLINPSTSVSKYVAGALTDVSVGSTVMVSGTTNSDGSVSATMIQLRPASATPTSQTTPAQ